MSPWRAAPAWTEVVRRDRRVRRLPALVDVFWALRHLREVRQVDWSDASLDYRLIEILNRAFDGLYRRYFRMEVRGFENIPGSAAVLVGNHSGFGVAELLMLLVAWYRRFGTTRRPCCLAHQWLYTTPFLRVVVPKIGGVRASWRNARQMLAAGHALTLFPGGEHESTRPFTDRYRVELHGRRGFVRLAFANNAPVVPFVTIGSHATMILPPGMHFLAAATGARRYLGLEAVPLPLQALVWLLAGMAFGQNWISGWLFLLLLLATPPLYPSKITTVYGRPITPNELLTQAAPGDDPIDAGYRHVERVMQGMMDELAAERRWLFS